jgi:CBS domain-containing protein
MRVKDIMKKVITVTEDKTLRAAAGIMAQKGIGCLVVSSGGDVAGIITERDVLKAVSKDPASLDSDIRAYVSRKIITIDAESEISHAANLMKENSIKKLPVVSFGKLVGIITSTDIVANSEEVSDPSFF